MPDIDAFTSLDVAERIVKPRTAKLLCPYTDIVRGKVDAASRPYVDKADVYVVHAAGSSFRDTLAALEQFSVARPFAYFWLDMLAHNLHDNSALGDAWWQAGLAQTQERAGTVLVVLSPWTSPAVLQQQQCLWELACALNQPSMRVVPKLGAADITAMRAAVLSDPLCLLPIVDAVDCEHAADAHQALISNAIEDSVGFGSVDSKVKEAARGWFVQLLKELSKTSLEHGNLESDIVQLGQVGAALKSLGATDDAVKYLERCLAICRGVLGEQHGDTAACYSNLGLSYQDKSDYVRAVDCFQRAADIETVLLGPNHADTIATYKHLVHVHAVQGSTDKFIECHKRILEAMYATVGAQHPDCDASFTAIAEAYETLKDYRKVVEYLRKSLAVKMVTAAPNSTDVALTHITIASAYESLSEPDAALDHYKKALEIQRAALPPNHPDIVDTCKNIGLVYAFKNDHATALKHYKSALDMEIVELGRNHPDHILSYLNIAGAYFIIKEYNLAISNYEKALELQRQHLDHTDLEIAETYGNLGASPSLH